MGTLHRFLSECEYQIDDIYIVWIFPKGTKLETKLDILRHEQETYIFSIRTSLYLRK